MDCARHPGREALAACRICGRAICGECRRPVAGEDLCPEDFAVVEERLAAEAYHLPPRPSAVSAVEALAAAWAVAGAVAIYLPWYRTILRSATATAVEDANGWQAGVTGAGASLVLLVGAIVIGALFLVRLVRPSAFSPAISGRAAIALGSLAFGLAVVRAATRHGDAYTGLWLALAASGVLALLGLRLLGED